MDQVKRVLKVSEKNTRTRVKVAAREKGYTCSEEWGFLSFLHGVPLILSSCKAIFTHATHVLLTQLSFREMRDYS